MEWSIAIVALTLLGVAAISRTLYGTPVTPAMVLVAAGLLLGPEVLGGVDIESSSVVVQSLAEVTLALVLFCDASRIDLRQFRLDFGVPIALYAVLSLTVVRMLPVVIAMWGTRAKSPTLGFLGWFGPRGLASIVFAVIIVEEANLPHEHLIVLAIYLTVGLSVFAHGASAAPLADRYARWYQSHPTDEAPPMESRPTDVTRVRGPADAPAAGSP